MKRQERFADAPISPIRQLFQRDPGPLPKDTPLLGHELRNRTIPILSPRAPPSRCLPDRVAPARVATRRPQHSVRRGQDEPIRLGALQDHIGEREHIRRPLEQLIPDRAPRDRLPRRRQRRLPQPVIGRALVGGRARTSWTRRDLRVTHGWPSARRRPPPRRPGRRPRLTASITTPATRADWESAIECEPPSISTVVAPIRAAAAR